MKIVNSTATEILPQKVIEMVCDYSQYSTSAVLSDANLENHICGCASNDRRSQKAVYNAFYGYAKAICDQYTSDEEDSVEILNDGFLKVFKHIHNYRPIYANPINSFKGWLKKIMIYTAIDHFRKNNKYRKVVRHDSEMTRWSDNDEGFLDRITYDQLGKAIQLLTPAYRDVTHLYIIEGYRHQEIADILGISVGTSKSNLARGRRRLQKILLERYDIGVNMSRDRVSSTGEKSNHKSFVS